MKGENIMEKTRKTTGAGSFLRWFLLIFVLTAFCNLWGSSAKAADFMAWKDLDAGKTVTYTSFTLREDAKVTVTLQSSKYSNKIWLRQGDTDEKKYAQLQVEGTEESYGSVSKTLYLSAGKYDIRARASTFIFSKGGEMDGRIRVKVEAESLHATDTEPNDTIEQAMTLPLEMQVSAALTENDSCDYYKVTIGKGFLNMAMILGSYKRVYIFDSMGNRLKEHWNNAYSCSEEIPGSWTFQDDNLEAGVYYICVTGSVGKYKLMAAAADGDLGKQCSVSVKDVSYIYDGRTKTPDVTVVKNGTTLKKGTDYTLSYQDNVNAGTAKVIVKGTGKYTGSASATFSISRRELSDSGFSLSYSECTQTGKARKPAVKFNGVLKNGTDYTVSYKNNVYTGKATAVIKGIGNYTGTVKKTYIIKPKREVLSSLKNIRTRKIIIKWKKDSKVSGYQLQYATNKNFYYSKTANISKKATSVTLRYAGKGSRYYIRIRGYKTIKGTKYYGAWSKVKSCKVVR